MSGRNRTRSRNRILLVGMMGSGKSTVGKLLAKQLGWTYRDSDEDVEAETGLTVPEIFDRDGESAFRRAEADVLARACAMDAPVVVSAAGGSVLNPGNRRLLKESGTVVWLRARPETNALRVGTGTGRPLLGGNPPEVMARLYAERAPLYAEVADVVIDVDQLTPQGVVDRILESVDEAPDTLVDAAPAPAPAPAPAAAPAPAPATAQDAGAPASPHPPAPPGAP